MEKVRLFNSQGEEVARIDVPNAPFPDVIRWQGHFFAFKNGQYVLATLFEAF